MCVIDLYSFPRLILWNTSLQARLLFLYIHIQIYDSFAPSVRACGARTRKPLTERPLSRGTGRAHCTSRCWCSSRRRLPVSCFCCPKYGCAHKTKAFLWRFSFTVNRDPWLMTKVEVRRWFLPQSYIYQHNFFLPATLALYYFLNLLLFYSRLLALPNPLNISCGVCVCVCVRACSRLCVSLCIRERDGKCAQACVCVCVCMCVSVWCMCMYMRECVVTPNKTKKSRFSLAHF